MSREENIKVFENTASMYHCDKELAENIIQQYNYTQVIPEGKEIKYVRPADEDLESMKVVVTQSKTFDAARKYTNGKTAVLNFASATTPGGGVTKGATAQEECLCRCSTLYPSLSSKRCWDEFYKPHRDNLNALHNDDIIWTPDVIVFKDDDYNLLDRKDWKKISVITCAAPNLREKNVDMFNVDKPLNKSISNEELYQIHYKRAMSIFAVAAKKQVVNLVVGAFGCGAFRNDPETVAKAWKKATEDFNFPGMTIEFAVYDGPYSNNFEIFKKVFELSKKSLLYYYCKKKNTELKMEAKKYPWSASRIGCFAECSLKYKLSYVEGWKSDAPVNTQLADKGSAFHKAAESYHTGMSEEDFRKNLAKYAEAYHVNTTDPEKEFYYDYEPAIKKFFAFWKHFVEPREQNGYKVGQEQKVDNVINGESFTGSLDLCIENDMEILIFDYKTGRSINVNNYKDQQLLYAYMKGLERGWDIPEIAKKVHCFIFGPLIEDLKTKTVEQNMLRGVKEIEYTEEDLRHIIEDYYMKNIDDIHSMNWARARGKTQDFHACQWCPYLGSKDNPETGFCGCKVTADLGFSTPEGVSFHSKKLGK